VIVEELKEAPVEVEKISIKSREKSEKKKK
jgi:hypothetical protein